MADERVSRARGRIEKALQNRDREAFITELSSFDILIEELNLIEQELQFIERVKREAVRRRLFNNMNELNEELIKQHVAELEHRLEILVKELDDISTKKLIDKAIEKKDIMGLAKIRNTLVEAERDLPTFVVNGNNTRKLYSIVERLSNELLTKAEKAGITEMEIYAAGVAIEREKFAKERRIIEKEEKKKEAELRKERPELYKPLTRREMMNEIVKEREKGFPRVHLDMPSQGTCFWCKKLIKGGEWMFYIDDKPYHDHCAKIAGLVKK